jgi:exonuclease VII small subunit
MSTAGRIDEQVVRLLLDYAGSLEESAKRFREGLVALVQQRLIPEAQKAVEDRVWGWNPEAVIWVEASGPSGGYQLAAAENNQGNSDFNEMLKDLEAHGGRLTRDGVFYWRFQQKPNVGRKKRS